MKTQELKLWKVTDLYRFHRYVRCNGIYGVVRQNQFVTSVRNTFMLALALPLDAAVMDVSVEGEREFPAFAFYTYPSER